MFKGANKVRFLEIFLLEYFYWNKSLYIKVNPTKGVNVYSSTFREFKAEDLVTRVEELQLTGLC